MNDDLFTQAKTIDCRSTADAYELTGVARDHWRWKSPDGIAIVEFDAFVRALARSGNLHDVVAGLLTYDWLPVEGRDFIVQYDNATANGVSIESQVFYSTEPGLEA